MNTRERQLIDKLLNTPPDLIESIVDVYRWIWYLDGYVVNIIFGKEYIDITVDSEINKVQKQLFSKKIIISEKEAIEFKLKALETETLYQEQILDSLIEKLGDDSDPMSKLLEN